MRGCVVVHGFTGTPPTVSSVKDRLINGGYTVAAPCLAGHGGSLNDLAGATWRDWYETVRIAYTELRRSSEKVYYCGISLGALLGLKLALDEGWGVRALALMGTPIVLTRFERLAIPLVRYTPLRFALHSVPKDYSKTVADPKGLELYKGMSNDRIPVSAVYQIVELQKEIARDLKKVTSPLLLIHARNDKVAPVRNVDIVRRGVSSDIVESAYLERSEHVITMDMEKDVAAQKVVEFFDKFG